MTDTSNLTSQDLVDAIQERIKEQKRAIVAGLNREAELRDRKSTLRDSLEAAEHSSDRWQTRAEKAEGRVQELEEDRNEWTLWYSQAVTGRSQYRQERDDLRAENERLTSELHATKSLADHQLIEIRGLRTALHNAVPRVIEPSEVREGQHVALHADGTWYAAWATKRHGTGIFFEGRHGLQATTGAADTVVLLADASEDAPADGGAVVDAHVIGEDESNANHMHLDLAPTPGSVADILQSINDSIARALTPRRGEVINPDDLHTGDVIDVWAPGGKRDVKGHVVRSLGLWRDVGQLPGNEIRLVRRPSCGCDCRCGATP